MTYQCHTPKGNPCTKCGYSAHSHMVAHEPEGDPCKKCEFPQVRHRTSKYRERHKLLRRKKNERLDLTKPLVLLCSDEEFERAAKEIENQ